MTSNPVNKPIIAVDIDDVLVPHVEDLISWHNKEYGTKMDLVHYHSKNPKDWGSETIEEAIKRVQRFFTTREFLEAQPINEAAEVLKKLSENFRLIVITARDNIIEDATRSWLDKHFPEIFHETHFTARFNLGNQNRSKSAVALAADAKFLIDDTLENALGAAAEGIEVLLFGNYPWNQMEKLPKGMVRVKDWQEVLEYFDAAAG
jgi:uncharacterized HAD superfamily protein